jgi:hypothetical protein
MVEVTAEWALRGKTGSDRGYRLLGYSDGIIGPRNFEEVLTRFSPGTLEDLPQVTVSFLRSDLQDRHYLAIAIHQLADEGQYDADGRRIVLTRYFCVPFSELAAGAVSYTTLHETFQAVALPAKSRAPMRLALPPRRALFAPDDELAARTAALLLTGNPVCILDADRVSLTDRLVFIDSVMSLLPYGMRSRMSASTWTSSTYQGHKFRLFFSNAPRQINEQDHVVIWGHPERSPGPAPDGYAAAYLAWLENRVQAPLARLAGQTDQLGFGQQDIMKMLTMAGISGAQPGYAAPAGDPDTARPGLWFSAQPGDAQSVEHLLVSSAGQIRTGNTHELKSTIARLRNLIADPAICHEQNRLRYRELAAQHQLLRLGLQTGRLEASFYDVVLRLAFDTPLSYRGYCQVEDCLGDPPGRPPHRPLLEAISRAGMDGLRVHVIVLWSLDFSKLKQWLRSNPVDIRQLIAIIADEWPRPHHARLVCEATLRFLRDLSGRYDPAFIRPALIEHGFLAPALHRRHPEDPEYQVRVLTGFLQATFGARLDRDTAAQILSGTGKAPTAALLAAVLLMLAQPADGRQTGQEFLRGLLTYSGFAADTRWHLSQLIFNGEQPPPRLAIEPPKPALGQPNDFYGERATKKLSWREKRSVHRMNQDGQV